MLAGLRRLRSEWRAYQSFRNTPREEKRFVFYSEGAGYWTYFEPIIRELRETHRQNVIYVTSSDKDPILKAPPFGITTFQIGLGAVRTWFFSTLDAGILVTTMPDLNVFHLKRSPLCDCYVYVHHSIVSTHMVYRPSAFDHFDVIFCVGPHHIAETKAREEQEGLPPKTLVEHGYGRLDTLMSKVRSEPARLGRPRRRVIVAPSWGNDGLIERHGVAVVRQLIEAGLDVTLRPHPRTRSLRPNVIAEIVRIFGTSAAFTLDEDGDAMTSLLASDVMISDWSGAALEFAFGALRPVVFVDLPRKVNNPDYLTLGIEPFEVSVRDKIGAILPEEELDRLGQLVVEMLDGGSDRARCFAAEREQSVFHLGRSGGVGATALLEVATQCQRR